jgi:hypothetical protein
MLKPEIVHNILQDLQDGLGDIPVLEKYRITGDTLLSIKTQHLKRSKFRGSYNPSKEKRNSHRCYPLFNIKVYEIPQKANGDKQTNIGIINDISRKGIQLLGVQATPGVTKVFAVKGDRSGAFRPFIFSGTCRWAEETEEGLITGYTMTLISDEDQKQVQNFLKNITLS